MDNLLINCISLLKSEGYTVVMKNSAEQLTSRQRGVKPLLAVLDTKGAFNGFYAADKVVGKAAACIYVLLNICQLYAITISDGACRILERYNIPYFYENRVSLIRNRTNTDICPMEKATAATESPGEAVEAIRKALKKLEEAPNK